MKHLFIKIALLIVFITPNFGFSQAENTLDQNTTLFEQIAQVAPISINPYTSVFLTSACSKAGFHNSFVSTHPFYNNWFVLILFGVLFLFTLIVRPVMATNQLTGTLVKVDNWLENKAGIVIHALVILLPVFITKTPQDSEIVYQAGFISISFKAFLVLVVSTYVLFVIMTVRLFIDFLIFLSPIPFIDTALQLIKILITAGLVVVSIVSPITSVIITAVLFLISLTVYRRVHRLINRVTYFVIYPILNLFRKKDPLLFKNNFSVLVFLSKKSNKFKKGNILRLIKRNNQLVLVNHRLFFGKKEEEISFSEAADVSQTYFKTTLADTHLQFSLNRSYHNHINTIASELNLKISQQVNTEENPNISLLSRVKQLFKKEDLSQLKDI